MFLPAFLVQTPYAFYDQIGCYISLNVLLIIQTNRELVWIDIENPLYMSQGLYIIYQGENKQTFMNFIILTPNQTIGDLIFVQIDAAFNL